MRPPILSLVSSWLAPALLFAPVAASQVAHFEAVERRHFDVLPTQFNCLAGDLDGDGTADLAYFDESQADVYLNDGHAFFRPDAVFGITAHLGPQPAVVLVDLDGDGAMEMVTSGGGGTVDSYRRTATGFTAVTVSVPPRVATNSSLLAGDFDEDGDTDVFELPGAFPTGTPSFLENRGGTLFLRTDLGSIASARFDCACTGHFDLDNHLDVVAVHNSAVNLYRGIGDGTFAAPTQIGIQPFSLGVASCVAADLDGDGDLDLAVASVLTPMQLLRNDGSSFTALPTSSSTSSVTAASASITLLA